jgi:hypothetical protein
MKKIVKKMERFPKVFTIQAHVVHGKGKRTKEGRDCNNSKIKT